jgi:hypothetical protein
VSSSESFSEGEVESSESEFEVTAMLERRLWWEM